VSEPGAEGEHPPSSAEDEPMCIHESNMATELELKVRKSSLKVSRGTGLFQHLGQSPLKQD